MTLSFKSFLTVIFSFIALLSSPAKAGYSESCDYAGAQTTLSDCSNIEAAGPSGWGTCYAPYSFTQKISSTTYDGTTWNVITQTGCNWSYCDGSNGQPVALEFVTCSYTTDTAPTSNRPTGPSLPPKNSCGSIIDLNTASVGEQIPIVGAPFALSYSSDRVVENLGNYALNIPIVDTSSYTDIDEIDLTVTIAGRIWSHTFFPGAGQSFNFTWDGLDSSGNAVNGPQNADVLESITNVDPTHSHPLDFNVRVGNYRTDVYGLGEWAPTILNFYSGPTFKIFYGSGGEANAVAKSLSPSEQIVVSDDGSQVFSFDATGRQIYTKNAKTGTILYTFAYDGAGRLSSITDAYGKQTLFQRNGSGVLTSIVAPYGQTTTVVIDSNNRLQSVTDPLSHGYQMTYNSAGFLASFQTPTGMTSNFTYDSFGHLYQDSGPNGFLKQFTSAMGINSTVNMTTATGLNTQVTTSYDYASSISRVSADPTDSSNYSLNLASGSESYSNHVEGTTTNYGQDIRFGAAMRNPASGTIGDGSNTLTFTHNQSIAWGAGSPVDPFTYNSVTDQYVDNSHTYTSVFTKSTGQTVATSPVGRLTYSTQDTYGKPTSVQWASYSPTTFSYDTNGRLQTMAQSTRSTTYAYGTDGLLSSVTNPMSQVTSMVYDGNGRLTSLTLPDLRVVGYSYDSSGNLAGVTPPNSLQHAFSYDGSELLSQYTPPAVSGVAAAIQYVYDADREISQITRADGEILSFSYTQGLVTGITDGSLSYSYDYTYGLMSDARTPSGLYTSFGYNGRFLSAYNTSNSGTSLGTIGKTFTNDFLTASSTVTAGNSSTTNVVNYAYDNDNLLTTAGNETLTRSTTTGQVTNTTVDKIKDVFAYDSTYGELATYTANYNPSGTTLNQLYYESDTRDALGRLSSKTETISGTTTNTYAYLYDSAGRLSTVSKNLTSFGNYTYDSNSNVTSGTRGGVSFTATYDNQDRLSTFNTKTYSYNANGERTSFYDSSTAKTTSFTYDPFGNLTSVVLPTSTVSYLIDGLGRRISKQVGSTVKAYWIYDGQRLDAELNSSRAIAKRFIYGTKSNVPDYVLISGTRYRIVSDSIGSVRMVVKTTDGTIAQQITYDERGFVTSDTSPGFQPFGFAGCLWDSDTQLVHMGAREYDPETGRFLTKDPLLFGGDDTNLYGYVMNDPINYIDPEGLYRFGPGAKGPLQPSLDSSMQCFEKCVGSPVTITSGQRDGSKGPHGTGDACDVGQNANPNLPQDKVPKCFKECFPSNSYGQDESNGPDIPGNHYHFQDKPGKNGSRGYNPLPQPYTPM